jgi:hypothetical protein
MTPQTKTSLEIRLAEIIDSRKFYESGESVTDVDDSECLAREYTDICDEEIRINVFLHLERKLLLRRHARAQTHITVSPYFYPDIFAIISSYI